LFENNQKFKMPSGQRVYIGNIPANARERDLEKFFKGYGSLNEVVVKNGYGFVEFKDNR
jgi:arginine/serine-rich splicing factor 4/5/6